MASLAILQNYSAVANNQGLTVPFGATGGSAPYVFSVVPGGAGGSINGSSGLYAAPTTVGVDTIQVTDSTTPTPLTASTTIAVLTPLQLVADIIRTQVGLSTTQVYLYNQKYDIPTDQNLYVAVGLNSIKPFGNLPKYSGGSAAVTAIQAVNCLASVSIHILSRSNQALLNKERILLALSSPYAESQMELNGFYVAPLTTDIHDVSEIDGAAIPYHYVFSVNLQYFSKLQSSPSFFSSFNPVQVITDVGSSSTAVPLPGSFQFISTGYGYNTAGSFSTVDLAWSPSSGAGQYVVLRGTTSGTWPTVLGMTTSNEFIDSTVSTNSTYYYMVGAVNSTGETLASQQASVTPLFPPPGSFAILSAATTGTSVALTWGSSQYASSYVVLRGTSYGSWPTAVGTTSAVTFTDTSVVTHTQYFYQVQAVNASGSQLATSQMPAFTSANLPGPFTITSTTASLAVVTVAWSTSGMATSYALMRGTSPGVFPTLVGTTSNTSLTDTPPGLTTYYYSVVASNTAGSTTSSNSGSITLTPNSLVPSLWMDGADSSTMTITGGSNITVWNDKSTSGVSFSGSGTSSTKPTLVTNVQNGLSAVHFAVAQSQYFIDNAGVVVASTTNGLDLFWLIYITNPSSSSTMFSLKTGSINLFAFPSNILGNKIVFQYSQAEDPTGPAAPNTGGVVAANTWTNINANEAAGNGSPTGVSWVFNGTALAGGSPGGTTSSPQTTSFLGAFTNGAFGIDGYIAEVVAFEKQLTSTQRSQVLTYLRAKWNVS